MRRLVRYCILLLIAIGCAPLHAQPIKIGFVVKQAEDPWFQSEWRFAREAAKRDGFELITLSAPDAGKALSTLDSLYAQGAQGIVICTPDVHLGPAIVAKAAAYNMKLLTVDDQFIGSDRKIMAQVHHLGISAGNIGRNVGKSLYAEMRNRHWNVDQTAVCAVTHDEVDTQRQRTDGAIAALVEAGYPASRIFKAPQKTTDIPGAVDAANVLLTQHPDVSRWLICGINDAAVLGAVRATESRNLPAQNILAIGIGGIDAPAEFRKAAVTGYFGSILLQPKRHGYETADAMYHWIKDGTEPPLATYTDGILITRENYQAALKEQGM